MLSNIHLHAFDCCSAYFAGQTVIDRYSASADSQKLRAARFLIENLSAHTSYSGEGLERYYDVIDEGQTLDNCPADALFLLHDCTRGVEDRVFTCEKGEVKWW